MDITGEVGGEPMKAGLAYADVFTGVYSAVAILAALQRARRDRPRQPYRHGAVRHAGRRARQPGAQLLRLRRGADAHGQCPQALVPYQVFPVADGHIIIAVGNDGQFEKLCAVLGEPALAHDPAYLHNPDRVIRRDVLVPHLAGLTRRFTREALLAELEKVGVPAGPINNLADVFADPQVLARGMKIDLPSPAAKSGSIPGVRTPITLGGFRAAADRPPPCLGEHTDEILREIGEA